MKQIESIKIGRLRFTIARKIKRKCADIYLSSNYQKRFNGQKVGWIVGKKALMDKKWGKKAVVRLVKRLSDSSLL